MWGRSGDDVGPVWGVFHWSELSAEWRLLAVSSKIYLLGRMGQLMTHSNSD